MKNLTNLLTEVIRTKLYESNDDLTPYELKIDMFGSNRYSASFIVPTKDGFETISLGAIVNKENTNSHFMGMYSINLVCEIQGEGQYNNKDLPQDMSRYDEYRVSLTIIEFIKKIITSNKKIDIIYFRKVPESLANRLINGIVNTEFDFVKSKLFRYNLEVPYLIKREMLNRIIEYKQSNLVYSNGDYEILLKRQKSSVLLELIFNGQIIGYLGASIQKKKFSFDEGPQNYYVVGQVAIKKNHRGKGLGKLMYKILIDTRSPDIKGLCSLISGRVNTLQLPKIYSNYDTVIKGGYEIIRF